MKTTGAYSQRPTRPAALGRRPAALRGLLVGPFLGLATAVVLLLAPALASADTSSTLTVVGTSDVSDSGLIPNVIQPAVPAASRSSRSSTSARRPGPRSSPPRTARAGRAR